MLELQQRQEAGEQVQEAGEQVQETNEQEQEDFHECPSLSRLSAPEEWHGGWGRGAVGTQSGSIGGRGASKGARRGADAVRDGMLGMCGAVGKVARGRGVQVRVVGRRGTGRRAGDSVESGDSVEAGDR